MMPAPERAQILQSAPMSLEEGGHGSDKCYPRAITARQKQNLLSSEAEQKTYQNLLSVTINRKSVGFISMVLRRARSLA